MRPQASQIGGGALACDCQPSLARHRLDLVEDLPVVILDLLLCGLADLGDHVGGDMDGAALTQALGIDLLEGRAQTGVAIGHAGHRRPQTALAERQARPLAAGWYLKKVASANR